MLSPAHGAMAATAYAVTHTDDEWKKLLTPDQYAVLRQSATEAPFTSPLLHEERAGIFTCAGCDQHLYSSKTKFDSGTGWPSFWAPLDGGIDTAEDTSVRHGAHRRLLPPLRRPPRPCLQRWAAADGPALLHERRGDEIRRRSDGLSPIADRTFEIKFLDPGVQAYAFTFG